GRDQRRPLLPLPQRVRDRGAVPDRRPGAAPARQHGRPPAADRATHPLRVGGVVRDRRGVGRGPAAVLRLHRQVPGAGRGARGQHRLDLGRGAGRQPAGDHRPHPHRHPAVLAGGGTGRRQAAAVAAPDRGRRDRAAAGLRRGDDPGRRTDPALYRRDRRTAALAGRLRPAGPRDAAAAAGAVAMKRQTLRNLLILRRRVLPSLPQSFTVLVFWLLMAEDFALANVLMALLLALVMPLIAARLEREFARMARPDVLLKLAGMLLWDLVKANITVARQVLGPERKLNPHFIWIPLELTNIHGISALAAVITLTPGTVAAALTEDRRHMLVHVLSTEDPQGMIEEIKQRYEVPLRKVFP